MINTASKEVMYETKKDLTLKEGKLVELRRISKPMIRFPQCFSSATSPFHFLLSDVLQQPR